jgi:hypothetical protein
MERGKEGKHQETLIFEGTSAGIEKDWASQQKQQHKGAILLQKPNQKGRIEQKQDW